MTTSGTPNEDKEFGVLRLTISNSRPSYRPAFIQHFYHQLCYTIGECGCKKIPTLRNSDHFGEESASENTQQDWNEQQIEVKGTKMCEKGLFTG